MLGDLNQGRYRALELLADHIREPSRELRLDAIVCNVSDEDLRWVTDRVRYFILRLLEEADYDPAADEEAFFLDQIGLTD
jgi:hypothetical protein